MTKRAITLLVAILVLFGASACRSRKPVPPPQPVPEAAPAPEPVQQVTEPTDFVAPEPEPVLTIAEINRQARERGWIRDAFFAYDASTLDEAAQEALRQSANWLRENAAYNLMIEGHCDERGTEQYNLALGDRRAETAAAFLAAQGVDRSRISTVSYGEERPFETGSNEAAWSQNRRAHLVLVKR